MLSEKPRSMEEILQDANIESYKEIISPRELKSYLPIANDLKRKILEYRSTIIKIL